MQTLGLDLALFLAALAFMEGFAWFTHRYVMHGFLWIWHRSHHEPRTGMFELNDLFAVVFAAPAIVAIYFGVHGIPWLLPIGLGGMVHQRFKVPLGRSRYWKQLIQAHRIHHAVHTKDGAVSFGFLLARPVRELKAKLREKGVDA
jgi:beta-carotene 3-hydroxylase